MTIHDFLPSKRNMLDWFLGVKRPNGASIIKETGAMNSEPRVNHFLVANSKSILNHMVEKIYETENTPL